MGSLLVKNAEILVTMDEERRELKDAALFAVDGIIQQVGSTADLPNSADTVLDLSGQVVMPGLVNTHHHLNQTLFRNWPEAQNNNLFSWLKVQYKLWAGTTAEASRCSSLIGLAELALSGCTTAFDHSYIFKNGNSVDCQIAAAKELGIRFHASRGSMSLGESKGGLPPDDCVEDERSIIKDSQRVIEQYHDTSIGSMTQIVLAPCSPFSVSPDLLLESADLARCYNVKLHTHLCETVDEERYTLERFQMRPIDWMESLRWLKDDVWFAHAIHVEEDEIQKMAKAGCGVAHCPCSNMRLASGIAPIKKYLAAGVKVGLGVDGSASNDSSHMLQEVRQAMLLSRLRLGLRSPEGPSKYAQLAASHPLRAQEWMTAREALELGTIGGAKVLGRNDIGSLESGKCADFFSINLHTVDYAGALHDPVAATLFCAPQKASYTIVNGRIVVDRGELVTIDIRPVIEVHNRWSRILAEKSV